MLKEGSRVSIFCNLELAGKGIIQEISRSEMKIKEGRAVFTYAKIANAWRLIRNDEFAGGNVFSQNASYDFEERPRKKIGKRHSRA